MIVRRPRRCRRGPRILTIGAREASCCIEPAGANVVSGLEILLELGPSRLDYPLFRPLLLQDLAVNGTMPTFFKELHRRLPEMLQFEVGKELGAQAAADR